MRTSSSKIINLHHARQSFADGDAFPHSPLEKFKFSLFSPMKDVSVMVNRHCALLEEVIEHLDAFVENNSDMAADKVLRLEQKRDDLKLGSLTELIRAFVTPMRDDIHRAVHSMDAAIDFAKNTVQEMQMLEITSDSHIVGMMGIIKQGTAYLSNGLDNVQNNRQQAQQDFEELRRTKRSIDKLYRLAIANLFSADAKTHPMRNQNDDTQAHLFNLAVGIFKRREIYRHFYNIGDQLALTGGALRNLVEHGI